MPLTVRQQLVEALRKVRERVAHGYPSLNAAQGNLLVGQGRQPLSAEALAALTHRLARARASFDRRQLIPNSTQAEAQGLLWEDGAERTLTRAQMLVLLDELILEAQRPPAPQFGPLFDTLH